MDMTKILELVQAIVSAAPAIEEGIADVGLYVNAIASMIKSGGTPSDADWQTLKASLDAGSATLQTAADDAAKEIQQTTGQE